MSARAKSRSPGAAPEAPLASERERATDPRGRPSGRPRGSVAIMKNVSFSFDCSDADERESGIAAANRAVAAGQLVVLPTDTVYGVGVDAFDPTAVADLLAAKGRGRDACTGVGRLVEDDRRPGRRGRRRGPVADRSVLARRPDPRRDHAPSFAWDLGDARGTVAVRMPLHPVAIELLAQTGPMAVSSANRPAARPPPRWRTPTNSSATRSRLPRRRTEQDRSGVDDRRRHRRNVPCGAAGRGGSRRPA